MQVADEKLITSLITGDIFYSVNIGGIVRYFKNQAGVYRYMKKMGYEYVTYKDGEIYVGQWEKTKLSDAEVWLKQKFKIHQ